MLRCLDVLWALDRYWVTKHWAYKCVQATYLLNSVFKQHMHWTVVVVVVPDMSSISAPIAPCQLYRQTIRYQLTAPPSWSVQQHGSSTKRTKCYISLKYITFYHYFTLCLWLFCPWFWSNKSYFDEGLKFIKIYPDIASYRVLWCWIFCVHVMEIFDCWNENIQCNSKKDATRSVSYDAPVLCQSGPSQRPVSNPFVIASSHTDAASDDGDVD